MSDRRCINDYCQSKPKSKLFAAQKCMCNYYNVSYRPDRQVCGPCMQKCIIYFDRIGRRFKNGECILDGRYPKKQSAIIELSDSDDDNAVDNYTEPSTENLDPQIAELSTSLRTIIQDTVEPLYKRQEELCKSYLISKKAELVAGNEKINELADQVDQSIAQLYNKLYKFDSQRKFMYDPEISIQENLDDDVSIISTKTLPGFPDDLPEEGLLIRHLLKVGDKVYGMKHSQMQPWIEATIKSAVSDTHFNILFDDGEEKVLNYKNLAYIDATSHAQYSLGSRVIAKFQDMNIQLTDKFYVGVIAEPPKNYNNFRYMIFFDDGYTQYAYHKNIRLVCGESPNVCDDVHENIREFLKNYLYQYPERPMVKFNKKQVVRTELRNLWCSAKVKNLDASLVQLKFLDMKIEHTEWMYRGSNRLSPIYNQLSSNNQDKRVRSTVLTDVNKLLNRPYIEIENLTENEKSVDIDNSDNTQKPQENNGVIKSIEIPANCPKPLPYKHHECSHFCMLWVHYDYSQTKCMNVLTIPLHYGFTRSVLTDEKLKLRKVMYTTPCGLNIDNENKMYNYLKLTSYGNRRGNSQMTMDLFNFDYLVNPLSWFTVPKVFIRIQDISYEMEFKPISVFNSLNDLVPDHIKYITKRIFSPNVNLNIDPKFLCGCDCIDNCEDKNKCSCWQLTYEGPKNYPAIFKDHEGIGYSFKRLHKQVITGIFECNSNCKCKKTCLNRVVQEPLKTSLQLFLTEKKGWGVRTLTDIPKGSFVCTFLGVVRTEKDADNDFSLNWGEYLADLDFLETVEEIKDGYESYVVQPEDESEDYTSSSDDEEFNPSWAIKKKMSMFESRMSLRKNLQNTNTKIDGKHELSKLNTQPKVDSKNTSLLSYLDKDRGIYTLDAKVNGNIGRYFNHSCDPNIFVQNVFIDTHDLRFPWVSYFALSNIQAGTELAWDYNYMIGSVKNKRLMCHCGSTNCKGRLL
ncbi:unnamed protein product [Macrosiphum euphorbiae]|uniref:Histone-lysine N-methyltransferase eggless n=1 Tax=Macrosiphum euphorbiae TaxID=13131 RepID=A0AAV0X250_9HEMI|nr:unnamed protein product [Macrosiphum euphorbiae]